MYTTAEHKMDITTVYALLKESLLKEITIHFVTTFFYNRNVPRQVFLLFEELNSKFRIPAN